MTPRTLLWTVHHEDRWIQIFLDDFGLNGTEVVLLSSGGEEALRHRFVDRRFAEEWAEREHRRLLTLGWQE